MKSISVRFLGAVLLSNATNAPAAEFVPNHVFASSALTDAVYELDPAGSLVRTILMNPIGCPNPGALAFSPRGTLFVVSSSSQLVVEIDALGAKVSEFTASLTGSLRSIAVGPDGNLYLGSSSFKGYEVRTPDGVLIETSTHDESTSGNGLAIAADGAIWSVSDGTESIYRWSVPDQQPAGFWVSPFSDNATGCIVLDARGRLHVGFDEGVHVYDGAMTKVDEYATGSAQLLKRGLAIGPNGNSFLCSFFSGNPAILEYDLETGDFVRTLGVSQIGGGDFDGIAFAPYRFTVSVEGPGVFVDSSNKLDEKGASLTLFPGAGRAFLQFDDATLDNQDFASLFGTTTLAFVGHERAKTGKTLRFGGFQAPFGANTRGLASMSLEVKGKTDSDTGYFAPKSATGGLHRSGVAGILSATVKTKKLIK